MKVILDERMKVLANFDGTAGLVNQAGKSSDLTKDEKRLFLQTEQDAAASRTAAQGMVEKLATKGAAAGRRRRAPDGDKLLFIGAGSLLDAPFGGAPERVSGPEPQIRRSRWGSISAESFWPPSYSPWGWPFS